MQLQLRPYQSQAIQAIYNHFESESSNALLSIPTGCGKSIIIAEFMRDAIAKWPNTRFVVATFAKELVSQNYAELKGLWPNAPAGIISAGLNKKEYNHQIVFAGIQTAYKMAYKLQHVDVLIVDEVQAIPRSGDGMWLTFINTLMKLNPYMKIVGLSATTYRMDSGALYGNDGHFFTKLCYEVNVVDMIKQEYLCELVSAPTKTHLDVRGVGKRGGDFVAGELERAVDKDDVTKAIVSDFVVHGVMRRSWLIFASGQKHAEHIRDEVRRNGFDCHMVTSKTPTKERDSLLKAFKEFKIKSLVVIGIGKVGFNHPGLDMIVDMQPTESTGSHVQKLGRGLRKYPSKSNCLILDYANNLVRHGPLDKIRGSDGKKTDGTGEAPTKVCPSCLALMYASTMKCECGFEFEEAVVKLSKKASDSAIFSHQIKDEWVPVSKWSFSTHKKVGKPDSLLVTYDLGMTEQKEWILLEHGGYGQDKAVRWWRDHGGLNPVPANVLEGLARIAELKKPTQISVGMDGKFSVVRGFKL